jgi:hypothetical protein
VAVVVPSPALSEVLEATSFTIWAPMFSTSSSSISLATVTPSLVIVGEPKLFSMTTLRPLGPRVTLTASARASTPKFWKSKNGLGVRGARGVNQRGREGPLRNDARPRSRRGLSSSRRMRCSAPSSLISVPAVLAEQHAVADLDLERDHRSRPAVVEHLAVGPTATDLALDGLFLGWMGRRVGDDAKWPHPW